MKKHLSAFIIIIFFSCNTGKKNNGIAIFNNISFKLIEGEKNNKITPQLKEKYLSYFNNTRLQIPLLKIINSKEIGRAHV